eukprot:TRINITY_DN32269_c0_g1_i1.p1 TRINITY_DN32269_c0_g1~~TRINITY_DN32269_c0_g1_i1.p1  ORF type:complete len:329 (+),score=69.22 TRINITY_DN32269_c0_g1_i1:101-988(+)
MGGTLPKPVTDKNSSALEDRSFRVGATGMQGWRKGMEDAHTIALGLGGTDTAFFGVFDGHCGQDVAHFCSKNLHEHVKGNPGFRSLQWKQAVEQSFLSVDECIKAQATGVSGGCTAVVCLVTSDLKIVCGNAGDSRCVLSRGGKAVAMSHDHKPTDPTEEARIRAAGMFVASGRVNGNLALSRALGDTEFKKNASLPPEAQAITAFPDVVERDLHPDDEFIVLACDGIWDVMSSDSVVDFVRSRLKPATETETDLALICEQLCDAALAPTVPGAGCDNMTVVLVQFKTELREKAK